MHTCRRTVVITAFMALSVPAVLHAQQCAGAPSLAPGAVRVGVVLVTGTGVSGQAAHAALGHPMSGRLLFAQATGSRVTYDDAFDAAARNARVDPAYGVDLEFGLEGAAGRATWCPIVAAGFTSGPEVTSGSGGDELETEATTWHAAAGGWLGFPLRASRGASLIPAIGARLVHSRGEVTNDGTVSGGRVDEAERRRDTHAVLSAAVGGVIGGRVLVRPQLDVPVGDEERDDVVLRVGFAVVLGP